MQRSLLDAPRPPRWRRSIRAGWPLGLVLALGVGISGCGTFETPTMRMPTLKLPKLLGGGDGANGIESDAEVEVVAFGDWTKDSIHCAMDECQNFYGLVVEEPGTLKAEVYAPYGGDLPDFDLALLDAEGNPIARPSEPDAHPRSLVHKVEPGSYFLRVQSRGKDDGRLKYDIVANLATASPSRRATSVATRTSPKKSAPTKPVPSPVVAAAPVSTPATQAPARDVLVTAEVLDVEEEGGVASFVLLDAGAPQKVVEDMQGQLREGDRAIGQIVIVEVYADGSRARVVGDLTGAVGIDTVADIFN